jgi:hypothetical protein
MVSETPGEYGNYRNSESSLIRRISADQTTEVFAVIRFIRGDSPFRSVTASCRSAR